MGKYKDLTGQVFGDGQLTVLHKAPSGRRIQWVCQCECGNICVVRGDYLTGGHTQSCGCLRSNKPAQPIQENGMRAGSPSRESLLFDADEPYQNLANAIVAVAADDYRKALKTDDVGTQTSLERFFRSEWYQALTNVEGETLLGFLRREHAGNLRAVNI